MEPFTYVERAGPLLVSMPHVGTWVPDEIAAHMTDAGRAIGDTDWHVDRLYDFLAELDASVLAATHARYVVDLNRPPDGSNLYPGQSTPGLVPTETFDGAPIYRDAAPDAAEVARRVERWWQPYHQQLAATLEHLRARHGTALLWDAHSIRSEVPRLFEGRLPDLNLGTDGGRSCAPGLGDALLAVADEAGDFRAVLNGRFRGGHITRHYGDPDRGVHAVQLELSQITYMNEDPSQTFRDDRAATIRPVLRRLLEAFVGRAGA